MERSRPPAGKPRVDLVEQITIAAKRPPSSTKASVEYLSSGSTWLDLALGGGYPWGRIVNLVGDNSTGKTLLASELIAVARKKFGDKLKWRYNDAEAGYSFSSKQLYGFEILPGNILQKSDPASTGTVEEWDADLASCLSRLKRGERLIYVLDSLDSLSSVDEQEHAVGRRKALASGVPVKGSYGMTRQKMLSELLRLQARAVADKNCLLIIISQVRQNIGVTFGEKYTRVGGKALDFYAAQVVWLAVAEKYKIENGLTTGVCIKAQVKKNKVGKPFRTAFVDLLFDFGVDDLPGCADLAFGLRDGKGKRARKRLTWANIEMPLDRMIARVQERNEEELLRDVARRKWDAMEADAAPRRKGKF